MATGNVRTLNDIGLIPHCKVGSLLSTCCEIANVKAHCEHICFEVEGEHDLIFNDESAPMRWG